MPPGFARGKGESLPGLGSKGNLALMPLPAGGEPAATRSQSSLAPAGSTAGASALAQPPSYRVDGQESQLVVGPPVLGGDVLGLQVPAGERGGHVSGWQDPRKSRARMDLEGARLQREGHTGRSGL